MSQKASGQSHVPLPAFIAFSLKTLGARFLPQVVVSLESLMEVVVMLGRKVFCCCDEQVS